MSEDNGNFELGGAPSGSRVVVYLRAASELVGDKSYEGAVLRWS